MAESDSDESFDGFSDVGSDIHVNLDNGIYSDVSSVSSVSSDDDLEEVETAWSDVLEGIPDRPFGAAVDATVPGCSFVLPKEANEFDFFKKFFPFELILLIVHETNEYARKQSAKNWSDITTSELLAFIGLHIVFSVVYFPSYKQAWKTKWPFSFPAIPDIMTRSRFESIQRYFHCCDTQDNPARGQPGHDKLCHVRRILDVVLTKCKTNYHPHKEQAIDEAMIGFKGRLAFKQYLPAKPTKFGIKVWERANSCNGYVSEFQVYTGREGGRPEQGLAARVVRDLTTTLEGDNHEVYMDNFFSSVNLFEERLKKSVLCCGTLRTNRKGCPEVLKGKKVVRKQGETKTMQKGRLTAYAWFDKKPITFLSTCVDPTEAATVKRRCRDGTQKDVNCPAVVTKYNANMGGVDRADQMRTAYPSRKSRKWWKYIFWFLFDTALVNALICISESPNHVTKTRSGKVLKRTQLEFRENFARQLISNYRGTRKRRSQSNLEENGEGHWPVKCEKMKRCRQCAKQGRRRESLYGCELCKVPLCVVCFKDFHKK